jgi:hypothetical protein
MDLPPYGGEGCIASGGGGGGAGGIGGGVEWEAIGGPGLDMDWVPVLGQGSLSAWLRLATDIFGCSILAYTNCSDRRCVRLAVPPHTIHKGKKGLLQKYG